MGFENLLGGDAGKKARAMALAGMAATGGPNLNAPIPAELEGIKQAAIERIVGKEVLRGAIDATDPAQQEAVHAELRKSLDETPERHE